MKKNNKNINNNNKTLNITSNDKNIFKTTPKNKIQENNINSSNKIKNKNKKVEDIPKNKKLISKLCKSKGNLKTTKNSNSFSVPYQNILDGLMKFLENKIKPQLYEQINNYLNTKINNYYIDNSNNILDKTKQIINKNTNNSCNIYSNFCNFKPGSKAKKERFSKKNILTKLMVSNDYLQQKIEYLGKRKKNQNFNSYHTTNTNNELSQASLVSFDNYYKGSSENIKKNISYEKELKKIKINDLNNNNNEISGINLYKRFKCLNKDKLKNNKNLNGTFANNKFKYKFNNGSKYITSKISNNKFMIQKKSKSKSKEKGTNTKDTFKINLNSSSHNKIKSSYNIIKKKKMNKINNNNTINTNNIYVNNNSSSNNNLQKQNINMLNIPTILNHTTTNVNITSLTNLTQRSFFKKINLLNEKLRNKLKIIMNKTNSNNNNNNNNNNILTEVGNSNFNRVNNKKVYNLKKYNIFNKLNKTNISNNINNNINNISSFNNSNNNNYLINKNFVNKKAKQRNFSNIKKARSYRINNMNIERINTNTLLEQNYDNKNNNNNILNNKLNANNVKKLDKKNFLKIVNNITNKKNINDKKYIHIDNIEINNIIKSSEKIEEKKGNLKIEKNNNGFNKFQNAKVTNEELMKKIKNSLDDNLKVMLNFSYENFLSKESERD